MIYCIVPWDLAPSLHEGLRRFYRDRPAVEVVVERRNGDRRRGAERRLSSQPRSIARERRRVRNLAGRRVAERRVATLPVDALELPWRARRHAARLGFVERVEPGDLEAEDVDSARMVVRAQAGEPAALNDLYLRYFDRVYAHLKIVLKDPHEAEDAAQEVFVRVLMGLPGYELRSIPFRAWLFRIVRNYALNYLEKHSRITLENPETMDRRLDAARLGEAMAIDWLTDKDLLMLIERMPLAQRQVLVLRYMLDLSLAEIAEVIGRSPAAVSKLHQRSLLYLEDRLVSIGRRVEGATPQTAMELPLRQARVLRNRRFALK